MREKGMLSMYGDLKHSWGRQVYASSCTMKKRSGIALFQLGIWKLKGTKGGMERGRCLLCVGDESESHLLLKCPETQEVERGAPEEPMATYH
jgi:hypothetical protein